VSDANLVRRSQQGDRRAFSALVGRYDWRLRGLAFALLLDRGEMDAALSAAYLRSWRDIVRVTTKDDIAAWLYRNAYNACVDRLRLGRSAVRAGGRAPQGAGVPTGVVPVLAAMPETERVALVLIDREGFTPEAAARIMGLPVAMVDDRLAAARASLAEHLATVAPAPTPSATPASVPADIGTGHDDDRHADAADQPVPTRNAKREATSAETPAPAGNGKHAVRIADGDVADGVTEAAAPAVDGGDGELGDVGAIDSDGNGATGDNGHGSTTESPDEAGADASAGAETGNGADGGNGAETGNGARDPNRGRGRRARKRAKHVAGQTADGPASAAGDDPGGSET
jgi:RNA polymerase sigma-70 factor, ECF subfamily